jgi:AcrR family transcriptional regulator
VSTGDGVYRRIVPRLWNETIESHRREVREAIMEATAALVLEHGLRGVTMAQIADRAGIGRATLYKYFPDVDAILHAWHGREIESHLRQLAQIRDGAGDPDDRLVAVLTRYGRIVRQTHSHGTDLVKFLHPDHQVADAHGQLHTMLQELIAEAAQDGRLRDDIEPAELAGYCLHALTGAGALTGDAAVDRLVTVIVDGLRPPR